MSKRLATLIYISAFAFLGFFFVLPLSVVIKGGFSDSTHGFTLEFFQIIFRNLVYMRGVLNAFIIGVGATFLSLVISLVLAFVVHKYDFWGKSILTKVILFPIILPSLIAANGYLHLFGTYGILNMVLLHLGWITNPIDWVGVAPMTSIIILNALTSFPIIYLNIITALANIDPTLVEAANNFCNKPWRKFWSIILPLIRPGIFSGCTLVFIWSFTELGIPLMFNFNRITSVHIYRALNEISSSTLPYDLVIIMLTVVLIFYFLMQVFFRKNDYQANSKASHVHVCKKPSFLGNIACFSVFVGVLLVALSPHFVVILFSFATDWYQSLLPNAFTLQNYWAALGDSVAIPAIKNSIIYASSATLIAMILGLGIAFVVVRTKLPGRNFLDLCSMLPLAVPSLVIAFGLLAISQEGRLFSALNPTKNPTWLLIIAYAVRKLPFMVRTSVNGLQQIPIAYEEVAKTFGCSFMKILHKIILPLIAAHLTAGVILVFSQTLLAVSDSLVLAQRKVFYPISKAIYEMLNFLGIGTFLSCALGVWAMTFLAILIVGSSYMLGKRLGAAFKA